MENQIHNKPNQTPTQKNKHQQASQQQQQQDMNYSEAEENQNFPNNQFNQLNQINNIKNTNLNNNINNNNNNNNINNNSLQYENTKLNSSIMSVNVQLILKQIYEYYCQYGERLNTQYLKSHKFFKFAQEANLYDSNLTKIKLELIYKAETGNEKLMDFKAFLNSLVKIADAKFNNQTMSNNKLTPKPSSSSAYGNNINHNINSLNNRSSLSNNSFSNSQILENKQKKSSALGRLINEIMVPLHSSIFNNGSLMATYDTKLDNNDKDNNSPFEQNPNNISVTGQGMLRNTSAVMMNITRLDHRNISESKFIESLLVQIIPNLYEIYKIYFPHEVSISEDEKFIKDSSYKKYLVFLKEFDLCPGLITRTVSFQIFQNEVINPDADAEISENQEYYINLMKKIDINELTKYDPKNANIFGQFLNFFKFIRILVKISQVAYDSGNLGGYAFSSSKPNSSANLLDNLTINNNANLNKNNNAFNYNDNKNLLANNRNFSSKNLNNISNINNNNNNLTNNFANLTLEDKLILTLERIELSEGFLNLEKKTMKTHSKKTATLIPQSVLNNLKLIYSDKLINCERSSLLSGRDEERKQAYQSNIRLATNYKEICEFTQYINENWGDELINIFKGYCAYGDYLNTKFMTSKKFFKFLNDCKLLDISYGLGANFNLSMNESCKSLNVSRSVDNRLNSLITPKASNNNVPNKQEHSNIQSNLPCNLNKLNQNNFANNKISANNLGRNMLNKQYEKELENLSGNLEAGDSQILPGMMGAAYRIKLLKPNDIDSIFVKLCAASSGESANADRHSLFNKPQKRESNAVNNSGYDVNISSYGLERTPSSNRLSTKKVKDQRIQFDLFLVAIEVIARFVFEKLDAKSAVDKIICDYVLKNISGKYTEKFNDNKIKIEYLKKKQDDPELLKVLELIYETIGFAYEYYADRKGLMSFDQLMK